MAFDSFLLQLQSDRHKLAQLNEPFLGTMDVVTHPGGGTAHDYQDHAEALTPAGALVRRLLTRVSHTSAVEASPPATAQQQALVALGHPAPRCDSAVDDLVLRRLPARAFRDRQGLLCGAAAQAAAAGADGPGVSEGLGQAADARLADGSGRHPQGPGGAAGWPVVRSGLHRHRLRRLTRGMPAGRRVGAAPGAGQQGAGGAVAVGHGPGTPAPGRTVGLARRQGDGQRTVAPRADAVPVAGGGAAGRRRRLLWLRVGQTTRAAQRQLPVADVLERDAVHGTGGGTGALPRGVGLSLPRPETEAGAATAAALDLRPGQEEEG